MGFDKTLNAPQPYPKNSAVLITGCSSGLGEDLTVKLSSQGVHVFAGVRKEEDGNKLLSKSSNQSNITPIIIDVSKKEQIEDAVRKVSEELTKKNLSLYSLINNAGYTETSVIELLPIEKLRAQFEVNVFGHIAVTNAFLPLLRKYQKKDSLLNPRVIFVSSGFGKLTFPGVGAYCASKFALESLSDSLRMELQSWNIEVIVVEPGATKTNFLNVSQSKVQENMSLEQLDSDPVRSKYQTSSIQMIKNQVVMDKIFTTPDVVTKVFERSLSEPQPRARYTAGSDTTYFLPIALSLPDRFRDLVFGRFYR